jgi:hypothetical protein
MSAGRRSRRKAAVQGGERPSNTTTIRPRHDHTISHIARRLQHHCTHCSSTAITPKLENTTNHHHSTYATRGLQDILDAFKFWRDLPGNIRPPPTTVDDDSLPRYMDYTRTKSVDLEKIARLSEKIRWDAREDMRVCLLCSLQKIEGTDAITVAAGTMAGKVGRGDGVGLLCSLGRGWVLMLLQSLRFAHRRAGGEGKTT